MIEIKKTVIGYFIFKLKQCIEKKIKLIHLLKGFRGADVA